MSDGMYVSMNGAAARLEQLDSLADNLANVETPGFKSSRPTFESFLANGAPHDARQVHPAAVSTGFDLRPGAIVRTDNPLDVVPSEGAFFPVQVGDGVAYTRDGRLHVDPDGSLRSGQHPVLDSDGRQIVAPPETKVTLDRHGVVFADDKRIAELGLTRLEGIVDRVGPNLMRPRINGNAIPVPPHVQVGMIEQSNANPLDTVVQLVNAQRSFESSMQAVQTYKQMDDRANELGRIR